MSSTMINMDYKKFIELEDLELWAYMEPMFIDPSASISGAVLEHMLLDLITYDECHLVLALYLGAKHSPGAFAPHLPQYLAHKEASVVCATLNCLDQLPNEYITRDFVDSVRRVLSSFRAKKYVIESATGVTQGTLVDGLLGRLEKRTTGAIKGIKGDAPH